jgi:hypothetical protein
MDSNQPTGEEKTREEATPNEPEFTYELSSRERAALERLRAADQTLPRLVLQDGEVVIWHTNPLVGFALIMEALGTTDENLARGLVNRLRSVSDNAGLDVIELNYQLAMVTSEKPRTAREAALNAQFAAVDLAVKSAVERFRYNEHMKWENNESRMQAAHMATSDICKLARTCVMLSEEITRCRAASEQPIGKAAQPEGQASSRLSQASPPALTCSQAVPMPPVEDAARTVVPLARKAARRHGQARP